VEAEPAEHPGTGALASWVPKKAESQLASAGVVLYDAAECVTVALGAALRANAAELLGLDEAQRLLDAAAARHPALVREVVPKRIDVAGVAQVMRALVAEEIPLGDLRDVLEAIVRAPQGADRIEAVRAGLARVITHRFAPGRRLEAIVLDPEAEEAVRGAIRAGASGPELALEPDFAEAIVAGLRREREAHPRAVLLVPGTLRRHVRRFIEGELPRLPVLSYTELLPDVEVERVGLVRLP
jgi:type III secretory pathway component EscV